MTYVVTTTNEQYTGKYPSTGEVDGPAYEVEFEFSQSAIPKLSNAGTSIARSQPYQWPIDQSVTLCSDDRIDDSASVGLCHGPEQDQALCHRRMSFLFLSFSLSYSNEIIYICISRG